MIVSGFFNIHGFSMYDVLIEEITNTNKNNNTAVINNMSSPLLKSIVERLTSTYIGYKYKMYIYTDIVDENVDVGETIVYFGDFINIEDNMLLDGSIMCVEKQMYLFKKLEKEIVLIFKK